MRLPKPAFTGQGSHTGVGEVRTITTPCRPAFQGRARVFRLDHDHTCIQ